MDTIVDWGMDAGHAVEEAGAQPRGRSGWYRGSLACAAAGSLLVAAIAFSAEVGAESAMEKLATVSVEGGSLVFLPSTDRALALKLGGGDYRSKRRISPGQALVLALVDEQGQPLPDGLYKWELVELPERPQGASAARQRRAKGEPERKGAVTERRLQGGSFSILNGSLVDPTRIEEGERTPGSVGELP